MQIAISIKKKKKAMTCQRCVLSLFLLPPSGQKTPFNPSLHAGVVPSAAPVTQHQNAISKLDDFN